MFVNRYMIELFRCVGIARSMICLVAMLFECSSLSGKWCAVIALCCFHMYNLIPVCSVGIGKLVETEVVS